MCSYWGTEKGTFYNRFCRGLDLQSCIMGITPHNQMLFLKANKDKFTEEQYNEILKQVTEKMTSAPSGKGTIRLSPLNSFRCLITRQD